VGWIPGLMSAIYDHVTDMQYTLGLREISPAAGRNSMMYEITDQWRGVRNHEVDELRRTYKNWQLNGSENALREYQAAIEQIAQRYDGISYLQDTAEDIVLNPSFQLEIVREMMGQHKDDPQTLKRLEAEEKRLLHEIVQRTQRNLADPWEAELMNQVVQEGIIY